MSTKRELRAEIERLKTEEADRRWADSIRRLEERDAKRQKEQAQKAAKRQAEIDGKLKSIREGHIPLEDLRALITNVSIEQAPGVQTLTRVSLLFASGDTVNNAIRDALTDRPKSYSLGGYTGGAYDRHFIRDMNKTFNPGYFSGGHIGTGLIANVGDA